MRRRPTCKEGFLPFIEAKAHMKDKGITTSIQYKIWAFSPSRPSNIPVAPESVYRKEWLGWPDFLGRETAKRGRKRRPPKDTAFLSYRDAKILARNLQLKTVNEFKIWAASEQRPVAFPSNPDIFYTTEWQGYREFLGNKQTVFMSLADYKQIVVPLQLRTEGEFRDWARSPLRPQNAPSNPDKYYKEDWKGWRSFLSDSPSRSAE
jgi:hypothetical protein